MNPARSLSTLSSYSNSNNIPNQQQEPTDDKSINGPSSIISPKKKKMLVVARPVAPTSNSTKPSTLANTPTSDRKDKIKSLLNKQVSRDNNGKILMHSALGNPEDVEQFEKFLTQPTAVRVMRSSSPGFSTRSINGIQVFFIVLDLWMVMFVDL